MTKQDLSPTLVWFGAWVAATLATLYLRPPLPIDETRYLSVAWEMWHRGEFLVPLLNGEPYSHKPPLLFWLIHAGWAVFGVSEVWARSVAPLFALGNLVLTGWLGRRLWPGSGRAQLAPLLLVGAPFWLVMSTMTMFDMVEIFFLLLGLIGLVLIRRARHATGAPLLGVAVGLGLLAKGPVVLVPLGLVALAAPLWVRGRPAGGWRRSSAAVCAGLLAGTTIALAWALPAAERGGPHYAEMILWGQTAGRVATAFDHARPVWFYLATLPAVMLPWTLWPALWRGTRTLVRNSDEGIRLCLVWAGGTLVVLSLISAKQVHYLLPIFPALALLADRALAGMPDIPRRVMSPVALLYGVIGLGGALLPASAPAFGLHESFAAITPLWGLPLLAAGLALIISRASSPRRAAGSIAVVGLVGLLVVLGAFGQSMRPAYDLTPMARRIGIWQATGRPVAILDQYEDEFTFIGRLTRPLEIVPRSEVLAWVRDHPDGRLVAHYSRPPPVDPLFMQPFRTRWTTVWSARALIAAEGLPG